MNKYILTFNSKRNHSGFIIEAWDIAEARAIAKTEYFGLVDAIKTESGEIYPL